MPNHRVSAKIPQPTRHDPSVNLGATVTKDAYELTATGKMGTFEAQVTMAYEDNVVADRDYWGVGIAKLMFGAAKVALSYDELERGSSTFTHTNLSGVMFLDRGLYVSASTGYDQDSNNYTAAGVGVRF